MTTKTIHIAEHTVLLDASGLRLYVSAPENIDSAQLAEDISECICFDIKGTLKALENRDNRMYKRGVIGIDDNGAWECAAFDVEVTDTEITEEEA